MTSSLLRWLVLEQHGSSPRIELSTSKLPSPSRLRISTSSTETLAVASHIERNQLKPRRRSYTQCGLRRLVFVNGDATQQLATSVKITTAEHTSGHPLVAGLAVAGQRARVTTHNMNFREFSRILSGHTPRRRGATPLRPHRTCAEHVLRRALGCPGTAVIGRG